MEANLDLSKFWCWQKDCPDYGKKGEGNIVLKERYGKDNRALLKCRTCGHCFSETHGTPFFGLNTSRSYAVGGSSGGQMHIKYHQAG